MSALVGAPFETVSVRNDLSSNLNNLEFNYVALGTEEGYHNSNLDYAGFILLERCYVE